MYKPPITLLYDTLILIASCNYRITYFYHFLSVWLLPATLPASQLGEYLSMGRATPEWSRSVGVDVEISLMCIINWKWEGQLLYKQKCAHKYICADIGRLLFPEETEENVNIQMGKSDSGEGNFLIKACGSRLSK